MDERAAYSPERLGDWVSAALLLMLALPLMVVVAVAIRCDSPGPILVHRQRFAAGQQFIALNFRSPPTPVGRFLRYTGIENLPQLVNVLRGEMSCINPRPGRPFFLD